jgi:hypothetical protein
VEDVTRAQRRDDLDRHAADAPRTARIGGHRAVAAEGDGHAHRPLVQRGAHGLAQRAAGEATE